jgi:hypothetical protein
MWFQHGRGTFPDPFPQGRQTFPAAPTKPFLPVSKSNYKCHPDLANWSILSSYPEKIREGSI